MIKLQNSQISQILPECLSKSPDAQALSFALCRAVDKFINYCRYISVFSTIDTEPDHVLDILATELDTQYYDEDLSNHIKRQLIRNTLNWYMKVGTPAAVEELVKTVFGEGKVEEWFQYGGAPYTFKILTNANPSPAAVEEFEKIISKVKNIRSHLESVSYCRKQEISVYVGIASIPRTSTNIGWEDSKYGNIS